MYGAGGYQWSRVKFESSVGDWKENRSGWTAGGGLEYALDKSWRIRGEYLYSDLGKGSYNISGFNVQSSIHAHTVRAGINYRF